MAYLLAGPLVALIGIGAVFFVLRRKSEEKHSMYSARRQQIEHKVKAARQRTLAPHGHAPKPHEQPAPAAAQPSPFDQHQQVQPTVAYQYEAAAYEAPPAAPPPAPPTRPQEAPAAPMPWETPSAPAAEPAPASTGWDFPPATTVPPEPVYPAPAAPPEPFRPAPEPTPMPPSEPAWTPAPKPAEPLAPAQTMASTTSATAAGSWEIVSSTKESAATVAPESGKKKKGGKAEATATGSSWEVSSGGAPGMEAEEAEAKRPSGAIVAVAQYAVLVVGLVMVLIGVLVMVANSHVAP
jgi:hypothetical protein